ncbi:proteasome assembly chaperone family protein [Actinoallomurus soli]|uniref:proteasome assembly chaperone family protein n=1 Tax=Actinoallomurus soli TaxID=2952535 RepID=UPI002092FBB0|nr:PAC2 family protein [Actinoallomurus soli]MCO5975026.1 PAC2 family protein [Actinoallomurus soli]
MADPSELYTLAEDIPELSRPVLVYHLDGFMDAGRAGQLATRHLRTLNARPVATFDVDSLIDYRSRRPPMTFDTDRWVAYEEPELAVYACEDAVGVPFLVMTGPEPDRAWERFAAAVISLSERLDVGLAVGLHGIPMAVPHTRETGLTPHGNRPDLLGEHPAWINRAEVPGSAAALIEYRMAEAGHDAIGFAAHVPHYLAQSAYPTAAIALLNGVTSATGLMLPTADLDEAAAEAREQIDGEVAASEDVAEAVRNLEVQYDAVVEAGRNSLPLAGSPARMPDGEEIAAEFERFLAEQNDQ